MTTTIRWRWLLLGWLAAVPAAAAAPTVQVLETWPPGEAVTLADGERFHLRLRYDSEQPIRIWARPYFRGEEVAAGSNPSPPYPAGSGEAIGWFFFLEPGAQVDEVRISAGDGGLATPVVASWHGQVVAGRRGAATAAPPAWVGALKAEATVLMEAAARERAKQPMGIGATLLVSAFFLLFPLLGLLALLAPFWGVWRWRGGWRVAAAVPAAVMAFVVLRIVVGVLRDPSSHNLWPFEILMTGSACLGVMVLLGVARWLGRRRAAAR